MPVCGKCHRDAPDRALFCSFCGEAIKPTTSPGQEVDPLIGQTLGGKYFIQQLLGHGGMGDVYKATHLTLDRPVVLKLLKKLFHSDQSLVQRFHREARAASRLNHPNSITVIDFGQTDDGTLFMAMEYLAGRSLDRIISDQGPVPERRVIHIGAQILAALGEAHALGIIHRDLKPANVMIEARRDEPDFVKVLDFGIAKLNEPGGGGGPGLTQAGIVCGTPGYMSTEQVRGDELDARSDIYAVGVILYEMLTGVLPFESETPMGLVTKHLVEDPPPMAVRRPGLAVSPALEALIMRALARDRRDRFASADDMRAALLACAAGAAPSSLRPTPAPSSTVIFDPGVLPGAQGRPVTGASATPAAPAGGGATGAQDGALPGGATAVFPSVFDEPGHPGVPAPVARTPAPSVRMPAAGHGTPAPQRTPAPAQAPAGGTTTPAPVHGTPAGARTPAPARATGGAKRPAARKTPPPPRAASRHDAAPDGARLGGKLPVLVGGGVAALALLVGVVWFATRKPAEAAPEPVVVIAQPSPPAPSPPTPPPPDPSPPTPAPPNPAPSPPTPPRPSPPAPSPPAPSPRPSPRPVVDTKGIRRVCEGLNCMTTPPESSGDGVLTLVATPWANVAVDGREIGETPRELRLGAGTYRVRATHPALGKREQSVTVRAGKRQIWSPTFAN